MESGPLIGSINEKEELRQEVSRLQDELAESHAEREELESRAQALADRLSQSLEPSLSMSLRLDSERQEWKRTMTVGREREARQALLIHKLQNKVLEYRDRCQSMEHLVKKEERELLKRERRIHEEHSDSLESALIRLEEEHQRSEGLAELNSLLRGQLSQSAQVTKALREDLQKVTADWSRGVEEAGLREMEWQKEKEHLSCLVGQQQNRLMSIWGGVVTLRRSCHTLKTATDRDLWELRAEVSRLSSSLLSHCGSVVSLSLRPSCPSPAPRSTTTPPLSSTLGPLSLQDLNPDLRGEKEQAELRALYEIENQQLNTRISELSLSLQAQEEQRESLEEEWSVERAREEEEERQRNMDRCLTSVWQAALKLSSALRSQALPNQSSITTPCPSGHCAEPDMSTRRHNTPDLSVMLMVLAQAESALQWRHQEVQETRVSLRRLAEERAGLEQRVRQLESDVEEMQMLRTQEGQELRHAHNMLLSESETVASLRAQLQQEERRSEEKNEENERLRQEKERQEQRSEELERNLQRRLAAELVESAHRSEREARMRLELHGLQGALQREQLDRERAEEEAADAKDALSKARESVFTLSSGQMLLNREMSEIRGTLEKMAAINEALAKDKRELNTSALQTETLLDERQAQIQDLQSEVMTLRRELKNQSNETTELRTREAELASLRDRQQEMEREGDELREREEEMEREMENLREEKERFIALMEEQSGVGVELQAVQKELIRAEEQQRRVEGEKEYVLLENQHLEVKVLSLQMERDTLEKDVQELRTTTVEQHNQLSQAQQQLSGLEVKNSQLQLQVSTLQQTKDVLQGELQCVRAEMEREMNQIELEKQQEREEKERSQREREACLSDMERLQKEVSQAAEKRRSDEKEREDERVGFQRERMALSSELGSRDGEVVAMTKRMEGLEEEKKEMCSLLEQREAELERLQTKLASENRSHEQRETELKEESERWRQSAEDGERETERLNQRLLDMWTKESEQLKAMKREKDGVAGRLEKEVIEVRKRDQEIEKLNSRMTCLEKSWEEKILRKGKGWWDR
ncbi:hypothetical protein UPYG_G00160280 [Umbra pygmaea]|uniref:Rootletin-like coiled-coil domain-containing protein n=1 Tax=Umbra pygmaea TaxID=75934 RepID=A0ABD0WZ33_UMBPY